MKILLCVSYFGWNALPATLMYIPALLGVDVIANDTYIQCSYYNQIFLFFSYLLAYHWIQHRKHPKFLNSYDFQNNQHVFNVLFYASLFLTFYQCYNLLTSSASYWEGNDISNLTALGPLQIFTAMGVSFLTGSIFFSKDKIKSLSYKVALFAIFSFFLIHTFRGGRIYIFGIVIFLLFYSINTHKRHLLIASGLVGIFAFLLLPVLASLRGAEKVKIESVVAASSSPVGYSIVAEILTKTNSVMYGSYLIEKDGIGKWDGKMYTSTIYALIPRFIYPSKPEPGSVDGTQYGLPARASAAYSVVGEYNDIGNNGVPSSISSLWGGGWIAYIVEILSTAFFLFFINAIFCSNKPVFIFFVFSLISFPVGVMEVPLPTILIAFQRDVVIYFVFLILFSSYQKPKR